MPLIFFLQNDYHAYIRGLYFITNLIFDLIAVDAPESGITNIFADEANTTIQQRQQRINSLS
jgi:hypothetical protein